MFDGSTVVFVTTLVITRVIIRFNRNGKKETGKPYPPSLPALPLIGSLPFLRGGMDVLPDMFMRTAEKLGPVFSFYSGRKLAIVLNGKNALVDALQKHAEAFADRPGVWPEANIINVELKGIGFARYNEDFKKTHKLTLAIIKEFGFGNNSKTDVRIWNEVEPMTVEISRYDGRQFNPRSLFTFATSGVVTSMLFGTQLESGGNYLHHLIENALEYMENIDPAIDVAPIIRFLPEYRKKIANLIRINKSMLKSLEEAIRENKLNDHENTFVKRFLEIEGDSYDHENLLYILRDLCLASSDTIAVTLLWAVVELANHPLVQSRLQKEIDDVVPENRFPSIEDKARLPFTEATMMETMRLYTLTPLGNFHLTLKDTEVCGYFVPKDCLVISNIYSAHMDKNIWKDPENFRPERFLDADDKIIGTENFIPFSLGKRSCIGKAISRHAVFVFFASLIQHFELRPPEGQDSIEVKKRCGFVLSPEDFDVRFIPRKKRVI